MNNHEKYLVLIESLKALVRAKGWTYKRLAQKMKLSEPTVKRIFQGIPCNIDKITKICDLLGVSFTDLIQLSSDKGPEKFYLTRDQDDFFAENLDYYAFFYVLYYQTEGSLKELQKKWGISEDDSFRYLRKLEKMGLLELLPGNEYKFKVSGQLNVIDDGAVINTDFVADEFVAFTRKVADHRLQKEYLFRLAGLQLSHSTYNQFIAEIKVLTEKYFDKGAREEVFTPPKDRSLYGLCISLGPWAPTELKKFWDYGLKKAQERKSKN